MSVSYLSQDAYLDRKVLPRKTILSKTLLFNKHVLCLYGGGWGRLTNWYASMGARVIAVDKDFSYYDGHEVEIVEQDVFAFLQSYKNNHVHVLDIDPYGDPMPALRLFLENNNRADYIILTYGMISEDRLNKFANKHNKEMQIKEFIREVEDLTGCEFIGGEFSRTKKAYYAGFSQKRE